MSDGPERWSGHAPDLVRDNRLMHERVAEQDREIERLRAEILDARRRGRLPEAFWLTPADPLQVEVVRQIDRMFEGDRACDQYDRPRGVMGGPCLNCGRSQPEHVR